MAATTRQGRRLLPEYSTLGHAQLPKACNFGTEAIQRSGDVHLLVNACRGYDTHVIQEKHRNIYPLWCFFCAFKTHGGVFPCVYRAFIVL